MELSPEAQAKKNKYAYVDPTDPANVITVEDRSLRGRIAKWAEWRLQGLSHAEIAQKLGIGEKSLHSYITRASRQGWLQLDDSQERLEFIIKPKIVDNIEHFIDAKDRVMTIEAAKGVGLFKSHQAVKVDNQGPQTVLALKIEMVGEGSKQVTGNIVGKPKMLDGEVVDAL